MKRTIILSLSALTLFSCGGNQPQQTQSQPQNTAETAAETTGEKTFKYVEPQDSVVKTIWEKLKKEDKHISNVITDAVNFDYIPQSEAEIFKSKTAMEYDYLVPMGSEEPDNCIAANYRIQCYQTLDNAWIAIIDAVVHGYDLDSVDHADKVFTVKFKDGKISYPDNKDFFPENFKTVEAHHRGFYNPSIIFSNTGLNFVHSEYWPLKYHWNGNKFESDSKFICSSVDMYRGNFCMEGKCANIGAEWTGSPDGVFKSDDGKPLAKLELKDGIIEGYTILDSSCGVVQATNTDSITHNPVALGYPIKNVLDFKRATAWMKDTVITKGMKDGKYVITQQLCHDTQDKRRDVFIEFAAKDENSEIESIRVYSTPLTVTLMSEFEAAKSLSDEARMIFKALNFNEKEYGVFKRASIYNKNGFNIEFDNDLEVRFQIYKADGGRFLVVLSKKEGYFKSLGEKFWYYENGQFTPAKIDIPAPHYYKSEDECMYYFTDEGLEWDNDDADMENHFHEDFPWNGKEFESQVGEG
ncbi:MAG: hypothetical protein IKO99_09595 [Bacteroidales bacterium]|nr:hypothetical protein [Bacteroidales bacterium]